MPTHIPTDRLIFIEETRGIDEVFSPLRFDYPLVTDTSETGRQVMAAGEANLVPVTLELGSRLAAIFCEDLPVATAPERITQVKCLTTGQICATVARALVSHCAVNAFVVLTHVGATPVPVDDRRRDIPRRKGHPATAGVRRPGSWHHTSFATPPRDAAVMTREMFGPIVPAIGSTNLDEVATTIIAGSRPRPVHQ